MFFRSAQALRGIVSVVKVCGSALSPAHRRSAVPGMRAVLFFAFVLFFLWLFPVRGWAAPAIAGRTMILNIPRVRQAPKLEDFLDMRPAHPWNTELLKISGFIQQSPNDGRPVSQRTEVYLGYDTQNLYAVWVCFDTDPRQVRARLSRREDVFGDDTVELMLDTFSDQRRAYTFITNPLGVQWDAIWTEGQGFDSAFDTVWNSRGKLTSQGYVVWMAIPFRSMRFSPEPSQSWGILLNRAIPHANNENAFWPALSRDVEGRLNQEARIDGLDHISRKHNIQLVPWASARSWHSLDTRNENATFDNRSLAVDGGVDAKLVLKDSLVLDATLNPDFSQVESDDPQVMVNQRFEVYFPEKRPFFLENGDYFRTPFNLVFTRRIADPQFGLRLSGKTGPWSLGMLYADDESPGKNLPDGDPNEGKRAYFGVARVSRDFWHQSNVGLIYTDREFDGSSNRVGGADARLKLDSNWVASLQAVTSDTTEVDGTHTAGPAYTAGLSRSGNRFSWGAGYTDISPGFETQPGFINRTDYRSMGQWANYRFRPEGRRLISWGPNISYSELWDHTGTRLDYSVNSSMNWEFGGQTSASVWRSDFHSRLRPVDFDTLPADRDYPMHGQGFSVGSNYLRQLGLWAGASWGSGINYVPPAGQPPSVAESASGSVSVTLRPISPLRIDNAYSVTRLSDPLSGMNIFENHIIRSKVNWQFNRELSLRVIPTYTAVLANPGLAALQTTKGFNADILMSYLLHPGTALYVGYNSNLENLDPSLQNTDLGLVRTRDRFINDGRQFFVKLSYMFQF